MLTDMTLQGNEQIIKVSSASPSFLSTSFPEMYRGQHADGHDTAGQRADHQG